MEWNDIYRSQERGTRMNRLQRLLAAAAAGAALAALSTGCAAQNHTPETANRQAAEGQDVIQLVERLSLGELPAASASITSGQLTIVDAEGASRAYALPEDRFFVSIAPYTHETHPCEIHNLIGCRGELTGRTFDVKIVDDSGTTVLQREMASLPNGFIDLWLPRGGTYTVTIAEGGLSATEEISTFDGDRTCITTMKLS